MAWTAPRTWTTSEVVTASIMNSHVRDNFLTTAPAVASAAGQLIVATAANSVTARTAVTATVATSETTTSTSYADLSTTGPTLTTLTTGTTCLVFWSAFMHNNTVGAEATVSVAISGATTLSASDAWAIRLESAIASQYTRYTGHHLFTGLTAGGNTLQLKYKVSSGTGTFANRTITAFSLS